MYVVLQNRWLNNEKFLVQNTSMQFSAKLNRIVYCSVGNVFFDKELGVLNSDQVGILFDTKAFLNQCMHFVFCFSQCGKPTMQTTNCFF